MTKETLKSFLNSVKVIHQWPLQEHLQVLLTIDVDLFKKCMKLADVRYFTFKLIHSHIDKHPQLIKYLCDYSGMKTLVNSDKHPCTLKSAHYNLIEKIVCKLNGKDLIEYGLVYLMVLPHPEKLFGHLLESLNGKNYQNDIPTDKLITTLKALMFLMVKKNLQVDLFYERVYQLLPTLIREPESFELINTLLNSIGLSHVYIRNYYKLLSSIAALVSPSINAKIAVLLINLIRTHQPVLFDLIHDDSIHPSTNYSSHSQYTNQCYELKALQKHYHLDTNGLYNSFSQKWINTDASKSKRPLWDLDDVNGIDYTCNDFLKSIRNDKIKKELISPQLVEINGRTMKKAPKFWTNEQKALIQ